MTLHFPGMIKLMRRTAKWTRGEVVRLLWHRENECKHARRYMAIIIDVAHPSSLEARVAREYLKEFAPKIFTRATVGKKRR